MNEQETTLQSGDGASEDVTPDPGWSPTSFDEESEKRRQQENEEMARNLDGDARVAFLNGLKYDNAPFGDYK